MTPYPYHQIYFFFKTTSKKKKGKNPTTLHLRITKQYYVLFGLVFLSGRENELHFFSWITSKFHFLGLQNSTWQFLAVSLVHIIHDDIKPCVNMNLSLSNLLHKMMPFTILFKSEPCVTASMLLFINFFSCCHVTMLWFFFFFLMSLSRSLILPSDVVVLHDMIYNLIK